MFVRESLLNADRLRWTLTKWHSEGSNARFGGASKPRAEAVTLVGRLKSSAKRLSDKTSLFRDR